MLRVAIVGCGKIADFHAAQIQRIKDCRIVGVCDREPLMAKQLQERFTIDRAFGDIAELIHIAKPDVVHITTPPLSHYEIAKFCLERGCHVYVEKPFTVSVGEARDLLSLAERCCLKVTVGHDDQFTHVARRMRALVASGYLGGTPVHMESHYCYDLGQPGYAKALLGDKRHWIRRLPGGLLQNIISHGIARIVEFLPSGPRHVHVEGFVSPLLASLGERELVDELRVIIRVSNRTTAYFTFSSQMRPSLHEFRLFGPRNGLALDHDRDLLIRLRGTRLKSFAEKFVSPLSTAWQYSENVFVNAKTFLAGDFHMKSGMKCLVESFYRSITTGDPVPIPYNEILLTTELMESIFAKLLGADGTSVSDACVHATR